MTQTQLKENKIFYYKLKGSSSMEEHLLYKQEDGGSIPSYLRLTKSIIKSMTNSMIKLTINF